jgi:hemoglobin-like flavoprotein
MDPRRIALVQETFERVAAAGAQLSEIFYAELFAIDPGLRAMFDHDMRRQHMKFLMTLTLIVRSLPEPEKFQQAIQHLAIKHVHYGVQSRHFTPFGNALLRTLKKTLGPGYTREVAVAWEEAFRMLARTMKQAEFNAGIAERTAQHAGR